jgi:hypothetical protein
VSVDIIIYNVFAIYRGNTANIRKETQTNNRGYTALQIVGAETTIPLFEWRKSVRGFDRAATVISCTQPFKVHWLLYVPPVLTY